MAHEQCNPLERCGGLDSTDRPALGTASDSELRQLWTPDYLERIASFLYPNEQRQRLVALVAASNEVRNLRAAIALTGTEPTQGTLEAAAAGGALESCVWLVDESGAREVFNINWGAVLSTAARAGQRVVCQWCLDRCSAFRRVYGDARFIPYEGRGDIWYAAGAAACAGHVSLMDWLLAEAAAVGYQADQQVSALNLFLAALEGCDLTTAQRVWVTYIRLPPPEGIQPGQPAEAPDPMFAAQAVIWPGEEVEGQEGNEPGPAGADGGAVGGLGGDGAAAPNGPTAVQQLLSALTAALGSRTPDWQAKAEWLCSLGTRPQRTCYYITNPNLTGAEMVERYAWLCGRGCQPVADDNVDREPLYGLSSAVAGGLVEAARWLLAEGVMIGRSEEASVDEAAAQGHVQALEMLRQAGYPFRWNALLFEAAHAGRVPVMQWAVDHAPAASGCEAAVELLAELGCPMPDNGGPYLAAVCGREWRMLPLLRRLGLPLNPDASGARLLSEAVTSAPVATLQWLVDEGCRPDWTELGRRLQLAKRLGVVAWARQQPGVVAEERLGMLRFRTQDVPRWALEQWVNSGLPSAAFKRLTTKQREKVVSLVAQSNDVSNLELTLAATGLSPTCETLKAAAASNALDSLRWLLEPGTVRGRIYWDALLQTAASAGHTSVCDLVIQSSPAPVKAAQAAVEALRSGHAALADALLTHKTDPDARSRYRSNSVAALDGCDLATVQQLWARPTPDWRAKAEWLLSLGAEFASEEDHHGEDEFDFWPGANYYDVVLSATPALSAATVLERFEWLWAHGRRVGGGNGPQVTLSDAIQVGLAEVADWLVERGVVNSQTKVGVMVGPLTDVEMAAEAGHLAVLQTLRQAGCALNPSSLVFGAAMGGQIPVLEWVWDAFGWTPEQHGLTAGDMCAAAGPEFTAAYTAMSYMPEWGARFTAGMQTMRWLRAHGCPCDEDTWRWAAGSGCEAALELLEEWGCPKPTDGSPYAAAEDQDAWNMLSLLRSLGVSEGHPPVEEEEEEELAEWDA
ncbi:hypothetical protein HYH03_001625 [Edaphochlamys debaryana]|uniref:Ankyrin repeat domain-containing protein n=1 Tax=Edaphochlamys debaryana TaxID=47281 RepID=A0A835YFM5_9CHLO|nr:hypothetical protein HYH03_001625 [Edaphochlamys debaryana]|eukprot:KAG2500864.1 hypothetical protein HYH03_001625 [Edaphochlamys debaryana]